MKKAINTNEGKIKIRNGKISWLLMENVCDYKCSYCPSAQYPMKKLPKYQYRQYLPIIAEIKRHIPKGWTILLNGGGEPFLHPKIIDIARDLSHSGYKISIISNFSANNDKIIKFFKVTKGYLSKFYASLHLEFADPDTFLKKILNLSKNNIDINNIFEVSSVALPDKLDYLLKISKKFGEAGIKFYVRRYRDKNNKMFKYTPKQLSIIWEINRTIRIKEKVDFKNYDFQKGKCSCGYNFFALFSNGDVFRCSSALLTKSKTGYLGNMASGFSVFSSPQKCKEPRCICFEKYSNMAK